jgi:hypothetical protein
MANPAASDASSDASWDGVLAILADGARPDVMEALMAAGEMPHLARHFKDRGGFRTATGVFPTVSGPAHLPLVTGIHPGQANLPGIRWARRPRGRRGWFLGRTRSYMSLWRAFKLERDIPRSVTTLFHHLPGLADVNTWFVRGCPAGARFTRASKSAAFVRSLVTRDWYSSDIQAENAVKRAWDRGHRSVLAVFPAIDELGHRFGPTTPESHEAYRRFDACLGRLFDDLARRGHADRTLVAITSDHGQTATHTHLDIDDLVAAVYPKTLAYPRLWRYLFSAQAAAMVSGNALANVYVQGSGGWHERPDFDDEASRAGELRARLVDHPGIEHVIYRRAPGVFVVAGRAGKAVVTAGADEQVTLGFEGGDPLGYAGVQASMPRSEVAARTAHTRFPDLPGQLVEFYRSDRAGDLVVCARAGYDLRSRYEYQPHNGSHGCLERDHIMVPVAFNAGIRDEPAVTAMDLFPTILAALGAPPAPGRAGRALALERMT